MVTSAGSVAGNLRRGLVSLITQVSACPRVQHACGHG